MVGVHLLEGQPGVIEPPGVGQGVDVPERAHVLGHTPTIPVRAAQRIARCE